jgi:hypothetical protein
MKTGSPVVECLHYNSLGESHRADCPALRKAAEAGITVQLDKKRVSQSGVLTDGIATGLSRALVALEVRAKALRWNTRGPEPRADETDRCAALVRELLEALVDK